MVRKKTTLTEPAATKTLADRSGVKAAQFGEAQVDNPSSVIARVSDVDMSDVAAYISAQDPAFARLITHVGPCTIAASGDGSIFESLAYSVVSQQLSVKAADTIGSRLVELVGSPLTAEAVASVEVDQLRSVGLSGAKTKTLQELANAVLSGVIDLQGLLDLPNEVVHQELTKLWGIGRWTAEMTMIFNMGRLDVWPVGDLAVRRGWRMIHRMAESPSAEELESLADLLRPYRSVVAWYCWRATDTKSIEW